MSAVKELIRKTISQGSSVTGVDPFVMARQISLEKRVVNLKDFAEKTPEFKQELESFVYPDSDAETVTSEITIGDDESEIQKNSRSDEICSLPETPAPSLDKTLEIFVDDSVGFNDTLFEKVLMKDLEFEKEKEPDFENLDEFEVETNSSEFGLPSSACSVSSQGSRFSLPCSEFSTKL